MGSTGELVGQAGRPYREGGPHRISDAMSDQQKTREATLAIAGAVVARDGNLDGFFGSRVGRFGERLQQMAGPAEDA